MWRVLLGKGYLDGIRYIIRSQPDAAFPPPSLNRTQILQLELLPWIS
jgi:hypothetical protein